MRLVRRLFRIILVLTFLAVASVAVYMALNGDPDSCVTDICCPDCETERVARVIDGDTLVVDRSFRTDTKVRLFGVDTPERGERCFDEATNRLRELAGTNIRVQTGPRSKDVYGRSLYYVFTASGESVDEILVREGLGVAWTRDGQHRDALVEFERLARSAGVGCLW